MDVSMWLWQQLCLLPYRWHSRNNGFVCSVFVVGETALPEHGNKSVEGLHSCYWITYYSCKEVDDVTSKVV